MSERVVFPSDMHYPYQDNDAILLAMTIARDFDPTVRVSGSDGVDFYSLSKFDKNPLRRKSIDFEVDMWTAGERAWNDATPNAVAVYLMGNHEFRLQRYLWRHEEISDLRALQIPSFMRLDELGIVYEDSQHELANTEIQFGNLVIKHGSIVRKHSGYTARGELEKEFYQVNMLTGHTHRGGLTYATTRNGVVQGVEGFCLCDLKPAYVDKPNWQQGTVLVTVHDDGDISFEPILFRRRIGEVYARWRGKEYSIRISGKE